MGNNTPTTLINECIVIDFIAARRVRELRMYALSANLMSGRGYMAVDDYVTGMMASGNCSKITVKRWIDTLCLTGLLRKRKGMVYVTGRKMLEKYYAAYGVIPPNRGGSLQRYIKYGSDKDLDYAEFNELSKKWVRFTQENLMSYSEFQNHAIRQIALLEQSRMAYALSKNSRSIDADSLINQGKVESRRAIVKDGRKAGCSLSRLQGILGIDKMVISRALIGHTQKQYNESNVVKGKAFRFLYKNLFNGVRPDPRISFVYSKKKDEYKIRYRLSNRIIAPFSIYSSKSNKGSTLPNKGVTL